MHACVCVHGLCVLHSLHRQAFKLSKMAKRPSWILPICFVQGESWHNGGSQHSGKVAKVSPLPPPPSPFPPLCASPHCVHGPPAVILRTYIIHSSSVPFVVLQLLPLGKLILSKYAAELMTTECRTLHHRRPLLTAYKAVLYTVEKGLWCRSVLQPFVINSAMYLITISSPDIIKVAMSHYDFYCFLAILWWVLCVFMCMHCWCSRTGTNMLHYAGTKDKRAVTSQFVTAYRSVMQQVNAHVNPHCMLSVCSGQWACDTWSDAVLAVEHSLSNLNILLNYAWFCIFQCAGLRLRGWQLLINAWRTCSWETSPTYHIHSSWGTSEGTGSPLPWGEVDHSCLDLTVET